MLLLTSTSSLLSASSQFKMKQPGTPTTTIVNTTMTGSVSRPFLTPTIGGGHRTTYRINSINNLNQFNKTSLMNAKKDSCDSPVHPLSSSNLLRLKSDKTRLGSSAPNLFVSNMMVCV